MKYTQDRSRTISGVRRISKPGLRVYTAADKLPRVLGGLGCGRPLHQPGPHDRPRGAPAPGRRRGPLLRLVSRS